MRYKKLEIMMTTGSDSWHGTISVSHDGYKTYTLPHVGSGSAQKITVFDCNGLAFEIRAENMAAYCIRVVGYR